MDVRKYIYQKIVPLSFKCGGCPETLLEGIDAYIEDNGFSALVGVADDAIITKVIDNNLSFFLHMPAEIVVLHFSNYQLIERMRIVSNRVFAHAANRLQQKAVAQAQLDAAEAEFERLLQESCRQPGLYEYLKAFISDTFLDIDYAKGITLCKSRRLAGREVRQ